MELSSKSAHFSTIFQCLPDNSSIPPTQAVTDEEISALNSPVCAIRQSQDQNMLRWSFLKHITTILAPPSHFRTVVLV